MELKRPQEDMDAFHGRIWDKPTYIFKPIPWASLEKTEQEDGLQ